MSDLASVVPRLPVRYVLGRSPAFIARHLSLLAISELAEGEVRMQAHRHRQPGLWDLQVVARDLYDGYLGRAKPEPTIGQDEVPVGSAAAPVHPGEEPARPRVAPE